MTLFNKLFGKQEVVVPTVEVQEYVVEPSKPISFQPMIDKGLRKNMWVVTSEGVGVITGCTEEGLFNVSLSKEDGTNRMVIDENDKAVVHVFVTDEARKATIDEIPVSRRGGVV